MPSFGLSRRLRGRLTAASVIRCLIYGVQCRGVWCYCSEVADLLLGKLPRPHYRICMNDQQLTQQDVNKSLGLWTVKVYIGQVQLLYVAHVARLPLDRPERIALFGWLTTAILGSKAPSLANNSGNAFWKLWHWQRWIPKTLQQPGSRLHNGMVVHIGSP